MYLSSKLYQVPVVLVVAPLSAETDPKDLDIATKQTIHIPFSYYSRSSGSITLVNGPQV